MWPPCADSSSRICRKRGRRRHHTRARPVWRGGGGRAWLTRRGSGGTTRTHDQLGMAAVAPHAHGLADYLGKLLVGESLVEVLEDVVESWCVALLIL